jgi:3-dehydroquinate dehydratase
MKTTEIIESLTEWRNDLKLDIHLHPITLTLNAAIVHLDSLRDLTREMMIFTAKQHKECSGWRSAHDEWLRKAESITGDSGIDLLCSRMEEQTRG